VPFRRKERHGKVGVGNYDGGGLRLSSVLVMLAAATDAWLLGRITATKHQPKPAR